MIGDGELRDILIAGVNNLRQLGPCTSLAGQLTCKKTRDNIWANSLCWLNRRNRSYYLFSGGKGNLDLSTIYFLKASLLHLNFAVVLFQVHFL